MVVVVVMMKALVFMHLNALLEKYRLLAHIDLTMEVMAGRFCGMILYNNGFGHYLTNVPL